ncbi:MupA/Atu3671 family FMN-dependent luciferase-like monooxygenase [Ornithinibacillus scapharcae]|uniref:MupA/Atu3671 family FMN-dependent luciferase-like monooxygenase n=1 Tax=Ornithinibacillus scapharcae TaxID=1147159 RepID=UPI000225AE87|nr:MupA/Atu3671 family FMN-dependent luciferase-like monooxygenase [Ornithinibacillus scapharcae]
MSKSLYSKQELEAKKQQLLELMKKKEKQNGIVSFKREGNDFPASSAQQRLWFLNQLQPGNPSYNETYVLRLEGEVDVNQLELTVNDIISRHEVLRTNFYQEEDQVMQIVHPSRKVKIEQLDPISQSILNQQIIKEEVINSFARRSFDLVKDSLVRIGISPINEKVSLLVLVVHHIVWDATSTRIFLEELKDNYENNLIVNPNQSPQWQFVDYTLWSLENKNHEESVNYWKEKLTNHVQQLDLQISKNRPDVQRNLGAKRLYKLSSDATETLKNISIEHEATIFMTLLSCWTLLLHRYSKQDSIAIGIPMANRNISEVQRSLGFFANTVIIQTALSEDMTFQSLLQKVKEHTLDATEHQEAPFHDIVDVLKPERTLSYNPLFQVMFTYLNQPFPIDKIGNCSIEPLFVDIGVSKFDMTINTINNKDGVFVEIEFNTDLFEGKQIDNMFTHYLQIIEQLKKDSNIPIGEIEIITDEEIEWVRNHLVSSDKKFEQPRNWVDRFLKTVSKHKNQIAVVCRNKKLTYSELDEWSDRVAQHIMNHTKSNSPLVSVCHDRSVEMLVSIIGIFKAGGAYLPIHPQWPAKRKQFIIENSRPEIVITENHYMNEFLHLDIPVYCLTESMQGSSISLENNIEGTNVAYVIYTSGSTGAPKGVEVTHNNLANFLDAMDEKIDCCEEDAVLSVTNITFDISLLELLWPLTHGAKVVIATESQIIGNQSQASAVDFSLYYFASDDESIVQNKYDLVMKGVKFADENGFEAVWTPERHFHPFGGLYPSPSVLSSAIAAVTNNIKVRAGSVVLPLHNPIKVAEEWSIVDHLSNGRVGLSFAPGWHPRDFVLEPQNYERKHQVMYESIAKVLKLWRGERVAFNGVNDKEEMVEIFPKPVQSGLPLWITTSGNPESFEKAGEIGANILTHLLGQSPDELEEKIKVYRQSLEKNGYDPDTGMVTLMLHTFVGENLEKVKSLVELPFKSYLKSSFGLLQNVASEMGYSGRNLSSLEKDEIEQIADVAFERYFQTSGLFGTPKDLIPKVEKLSSLGVNEIACLIDFGIEQPIVMDGLNSLNDLRKQYEETVMEESLSELIHNNKVTIFQSTPTLMRMLVTRDELLNTLSSVNHILIGGEALPTSMVKTLTRNTSAKLWNMYGPTETTIWSTIYRIEEHILDVDEPIVPIGKPIKNTNLYVLDKYKRPVPIGMPGELYIGGAGVAKGYRANQDLNSERFTYINIYGFVDRVYQTGDIVKLLPDGHLHFMERKDNQVKIRGYRVELNEIERFIENRDTVTRAIVVVHPEQDTLIAFIQLEKGFRLASDTLKKALESELPSYMIPSYFIEVNDFPMNASGKVDRKELVSTYRIEDSAKVNSLMEVTFVDRMIIQLAADVLKININDAELSKTFFELGGNSLSATQFVHELNREFQISYPLRSLYQNPSLTDIANEVEKLQIESADEDLLESILKEMDLE